MNSQKIYSLDIIKLLSALFIFCFHSNMHTGANYSVFTRFISNGAIFMVAFFMLSGFTLTYTYIRRERENCILYQTTPLYLPRLFFHHLVFFNF